MRNQTSHPRKPGGKKGDQLCIIIAHLLTAALKHETTPSHPVNRHFGAGGMRKATSSYTRCKGGGRRYPRLNGTGCKGRGARARAWTRTRVVDGRWLVQGRRGNDGMLATKVACRPKVWECAPVLIGQQHRYPTMLCYLVFLCHSSTPPFLLSLQVLRAP